MNSSREIIELGRDEFQFKYFINTSSNDNMIVHPHWHDMIEILYVEYGSAEQHLEDRIFKIEKGDIVIIPSQDIHATYSFSNTSIEVFQFNNIYIKENNPSLYKITCKFNDILLIPNPIREDLEFYKILQEIKNEYRDKKLGWQMMIASLLNKLISVCVRNFNEIKDIKKKVKETKVMIDRIFNYIEDCYNKKLTIKEVAEQSGYSIPQFSRIFRNNVGMTFFEYLERYRIAVSKTLLEADLSITEIAFECGFSCINSYIRSFNKSTGMSPGKYRKNLDKIKNSNDS